MSSYLDLLGKPFQFDGRGPDSYDCYGLVMEMLRRDGVEIPDYKNPRDLARVAAMMACEVEYWRECEKRPGSVVLLRVGRHISHVGYVLDERRFLHTWEESGGVLVEKLETWKRRIVGYYEFVGKQ